MALNVSVFFKSQANFKPVMSEIAALNAAMVSAQATMAKTGASLNLGDIQNNFRKAVSAGGAWETQTMRLTDRNTKLTESLMKQEVNLSSGIKQWKQLGGVIEQQTKLRQAAFMTWNKSSFGNVTGDMIMPTKALNEGMSALDRFRIKAGVHREMISSIAQQTVNWGKNTQWAGRQLTVGLTVPVAALGVAAAMAFKEMDEGLTRIVKVYDTMGKAGSASAVAENMQLRADSMQLATEMAKRYGSAMKDTLDIESQLAASGVKGNALLRDTATVSRAALLGELDKQAAIDTTISLQNTFKLSTQQLSEAFDYMNSVENGTVLSMKDFTEAIPRAAAPIASMGGSVKDLGTMLVAMKAGGIDAAEGANAIKSSFTRLLNPGRSVQEMFKNITGKDLVALVESTNGELIPTFHAIGDAMEGLGKLERQKIMSKLFGTMQNTRLQTLLNGLLNMGDAATQTGRAFAIANQSVATNAATADRELTALQQSASGKWKIAMATMRVELAKIGEPLLKFGADFLGVITKIMGAFNGLSDGTKTFVMRILGLAAIAGPITMLIGLMANLIGTSVKGFIMLSRTGQRFKLLTAEEVANTLAAKDNTAAVVSQTAAYNTLARAVAEARMAMNGQTVAAGGSTAAVLAGGSAVGSPNARQRHPAGTVINGKSVGGQFMTAEQVAASSKIAENAEKTKRSFGGAATTAGLAIGSIGLMAGGANETISNLSAVVFGLSLAAPLLGKAFDKVKSSAMAASAMGALGGGGKGAALKTGASALMGAVMSGPGLAIAAGLAAALAAAKLYSNYLDRLKKEQEGFNAIAKSTATIFGATYKDFKTPDLTAGKKMEELQTNVKKLKDEQSAYIEELRKMTDSQANSEITLKAIEAAQHGYDPEQVKKMVQALLGARKTDKGYIDDNTVTIMARVAVGDPDTQTIETARIAGEQIGKQFTNGLKTSTSGWQGFKDAVMFKGFGDAKKASAEHTADIKKAGESLNDMLVQSWIDSAGNSSAMGSVISMYADSFHNNLKEQGSKFNFSQDEWNIINGKGSAALSAAGNNNAGGRADEQSVWIRKQSSEVQNYVNQLWSQNAAESEIAKTVAKKLGKSDEEVQAIKTLADLTKLLAPQYMAVADAENAYANELAGVARSGKQVTDAQNLQLLNSFRLRAGLPAATSVTQGFGDANSAAADKVKEHANNLQILKEKMPEVAKNMDAFISAFKGGVDSGLGDMVDAAMSQFDDATKRHTDSLQAQQDRVDKAAEREKKRTTEIYDKRIEGIKRVADKEAAADKAREEMFQREKTRIERLAAAQNANIDFNTAINTGQFDQAAKIQANQDSVVAGYALDDAAGANQKTSEARKAKRDAQIESLNKQKDAALEAIDKETEARKKSIDAQLKSYEQFRSQRRAQIEKEMAMVKAQGASTRQEFAKRAAEIAKIVGSTTVSVNNQSLSWGQYAAQKWQYYVQLTGRQMAADKKWAGVGEQIADQIAKGATGMNWGQFLTFMATGKLPSGMKQDSKSGKIVNAPDRSAGSRGQSNDKDRVRHGGGPIGPLGRNTNRSSLKSDEFRTILQKGEYVVDKNTVRQAGGPDGIMDNISGYPKNAGPFPGLAGMLAGVAAMRVGAMMKVGMEQMMQRKIMEMSMMDSGMPGGMGLPGGMSVGSMGLIDTIMRGLKMQESGGNYKAYNPSSGASGAYQYLRSTWNNYAGFSEARKAPADIQDKRVRGDLTSKFNRYKDWRKVVASHLYPAWANDMGKWNQSPGVGNPSVWNYVKGVFAKAGIPLDKNGNFTSPAMAGPGPLGSGMIKPVNGRKSSDFGMRYDPVYHRNQLHAGTDFAAPTGTPIWAAMNGTVVQAGSNGGYGNYTKVFHGNYRNVPLYTAYAHQSKIGVRAGQSVKQGQRIGNVGTTGASTGPHLHFEVRRGNVPVNPLNWINPNGGLKALPQLLNGGKVKYDNTIANLHKKETVLTAPLSRQLEEGIGNLHGGASSTYNLHIDASGSNMDENLLADKIISKIKMLEGKKGISRTIR